MSARNVDRSLVLLSLQRAMLGEVFPGLRAITVEWSDSSVKFFAYIDGAIADEDSESLSCIAAEAAADFWSGIGIDYEIVRVDFPNSIDDKRTFVFQRRE